MWLQVCLKSELGTNFTLITRGEVELYGVLIKIYTQVRNRFTKKTLFILKTHLGQIIIKIKCLLYNFDCTARTINFLGKCIFRVTELKQQINNEFGKD